VLVGWHAITMACARVGRTLGAERRAGEILQDMEKAKAGRPPENRLHDETDLDRGAPTYAEMGLNKTQAHRWQTIAAMNRRTGYLPGRNSFATLRQTP